MRAVTTIIGVIIILFLFGSMMVGINSAQTDSRDDPFAGVTTGVGVTTADVELVLDPFNDSLQSITGISSDNDLDAPLPDAYVTGTNTLTVRGLNAEDTRTLTVTYDYDSLGENSGSIGSFLDMVPMLIAIVVVVIIVAAGIGGYAYAKGRGVY